ITQIAAGTLHMCALLSSGQVACWGVNDSGQIGGTAGQIVAPVFIAGLPARHIPPEQRGNAYILQFRADPERHVESAAFRSAILAVDLKGSLSGNGRNLGLLAANYSTRMFFPRLVRLARKKSPGLLPPSAEEVALQVERLPPMKTAKDVQ